MVKCRILDVIDAQDGIERAAFALMREFHPINVVRDPTRLSGDGKDLILRNVDELCIGSMKRRISQGQAIRSIFGCSRVTHLPGLTPMLRRVGSPCSVQSAMPPSRKFASTPMRRNAAATPWLTSRP